MKLPITALFSVAIVCGTLADRPRPRPPLTIGGYRVLAADFHSHSSMWSDGALTPWGLVLEAERQRLDVLAITGHNSMLDARIGRWFSGLIGGPLVMGGEEILSDPNHYHLVGIGIRELVDFDQPARDAIDAIHRQGGVAIAVHPLRESWQAFDAAAMERLDAAEICHPLVYAFDDGQEQLEQFAARGAVTAIGSSDFHGTGRLGLCRTFVFTREPTEAAVLDAIRERRTIVFGRDGKAHGDRDLIRMAADDPGLRDRSQPDRPGVLDWISRISGVLALAATAIIAVRRGIRL